MNLDCRRVLNITWEVLHLYQKLNPNSLLKNNPIKNNPFPTLLLSSVPNTTLVNLAMFLKDYAHMDFPERSATAAATILGMPAAKDVEIKSGDLLGIIRLDGSDSTTLVCVCV